MAEGPFSALLGLDTLWRLRKNQLGYYQSLQARYGDRVRLRLGPYRNWLLFHPDEIESVLTTHVSSFVRFEPVMRVLEQWNGRSLLVSEGARWRARRRQVLPAFARSRMTEYGARIVSHTADLSEQLKAAADAGEVSLDTDRTMATLSLRIALDALFGDQSDDRVSETGDAIAVLSDVAFRESTALWQRPAWWPFGWNPGKQLAIATMDRLVSSIVGARLQVSHDDRGDLLSMLIANGDEQDAIRDEAMTLLIAGHETTGAALAWTSDLLSRHPETLAQVLAEIDRELGNRPATLADIARLPLLKAVVDETLRLYPPAYALFPRRATERVVLDRLTIASGDLVQLVPFVTQRDPRWFEDADSFRPARFLGVPGFPLYAYFPFGAGPRVCIGEYFGLLELVLALGTLLQRWTPLPAESPAIPEAKFSLRPKNGLQQRWRLRAGVEPEGTPRAINAH
jgi:enediyne biosynthesis protein E7